MPSDLARWQAMSSAVARWQAMPSAVARWQAMPRAVAGHAARCGVACGGNFFFLPMLKLHSDVCNGFLAPKNGCVQVFIENARVEGVL